jgi:hypothetical protein
VENGDTTTGRRKGHSLARAYAGPVHADSSRVMKRHGFDVPDPTGGAGDSSDCDDPYLFGKKEVVNGYGERSKCEIP